MRYEVQRLCCTVYLVRVFEDDGGCNVCMFNVTDRGEALLVEGLRGKIAGAQQWRRAMARYFPKATHVTFERGSPFKGTITRHHFRVR